MKLSEKRGEGNNFWVVLVEDLTRGLQGLWLGTAGVVVYIELVLKNR